MRDGNHVILCIDDDPDMLETMQVIIEDGDFVVVTADGAEEGLLRYREERPDLVIVDLMMEGTDAGSQFVREINAMDGERPPTYLLSSVGDSLSLTDDYADLDLTGVLQKPISPAALLATLSEL